MEVTAILVGKSFIAQHAIESSNLPNIYRVSFRHKQSKAGFFQLNALFQYEACFMFFLDAVCNLQADYSRISSNDRLYQFFPFSP